MKSKISVNVSSKVNPLENPKWKICFQESQFLHMQRKHISMPSVKADIQIMYRKMYHQITLLL